MIGVYTYRVLSGDDTLRALLHATEDEPRIVPRATDGGVPCVVYQIVPGGCERRVHRDRIELRAMDTNDDRLREIGTRLTELLTIEEADPPRNIVIDDIVNLTVYLCRLNGGGELQDGEVTHKLLYFDAIWRENIV